MHSGKSMISCPTLKVHGTCMQEVTEDRYLGDILSSKCIKERISKGVGIQNQILNLLEMISFGPFHLEKAVLLRNSMLIPGTLTNSEIWYNCSNS